MEKASTIPINVQETLFEPSKIVCVGRNYTDHISELGNEVPSEPVIFIKPSTAISSDLQQHPTDAIHYEAELALVIKNGGIYAVGIGLDLTKRELQNRLKAKGLPWERAKAFDASVVFSDFVILDKPFQKLELKLYVDNVLRQLGNTAQMINKPNDLISNISEFMTLLDGDVVMTGTPSGVGKIEIGQTFCAQILSDEQVLVTKSWRVVAAV